MKFRRLTQEELAELETEFVRFLVSNTVTGDDWEKIKVEKPKEAEGLIEIFSDIVFEKILKGVDYLEFKSPKDYKTFHFAEKQAKMLGLRVNGESEIDFSKNDSPAQMMDHIKRSGAELELYQAEKTYRKSRAEEIFHLMESGALISKEGEMYKAFEALIVR